MSRGETTDEAIAETIALAMTEGINFYDVAPSYGNGAAERNLGRALLEARDGRGQDMLVATKVSLSEDDLADIPGAVVRGIGESLERPAARAGRRSSSCTTRSRPSADAIGARSRWTMRCSRWRTLQRLKQDGLSRFVGITGMGDAASVREVLRRGELDTVQCYYNLLNDSNARPLPPGSTLHDHGQLLTLAAELGSGRDRDSQSLRRRAVDRTGPRGRAGVAGGHG